ncbi:peptide deformylase [Zhihengliuella alba]|uniref:Peptide deformylase n=1 Tax=Zhihengliuella alba TaxID=547018 RepID=A0ABP7CTD0_9MICC
MSQAPWIEPALRLIEAYDAGELPTVVQLGHPALRAPALPYEDELDAATLARLLAMMRATMHAAPGVGLAAPQLGLGVRIAVLEDAASVPDPETARLRERTPLQYFAALNPSFRPVGDRRAEFFEGCLSFTGYAGVVGRPADIVARYSTPSGESVERELHGWPARIFQHETDHLDGIVYIDKASTRSLCSTAEYAQRWAAPDVEPARVGLGF